MKGREAPYSRPGQEDRKGAGGNTPERLCVSKKEDNSHDTRSFPLPASLHHFSSLYLRARCAATSHCEEERELGNSSCCLSSQWQHKPWLRWEEDGAMLPGLHISSACQESRRSAAITKAPQTPLGQGGKLVYKLCSTEPNTKFPFAGKSDTAQFVFSSDLGQKLTFFTIH